MNQKITQITTEPISALAIHSYGKMWQMPGIMKKNFTQLKSHLEAHQMTTDTQTAVFCRYDQLSWDQLANMRGFRMFWNFLTQTWVFASAIGITKQIEPGVGMEILNLAAMDALSAVHTGAYQTISKTYLEIYQYARAQQIRLQPFCYEFYLNDPQTVKTEELQTRIWAPIQ